MIIRVLAVSVSQPALGMFLQQPRSNLTEALEQCYRIAVTKLRGCWSKFTEPPVKCTE